MTFAGIGYDAITARFLRRESKRTGFIGTKIDTLPARLFNKDLPLGERRATGKIRPANNLLGLRVSKHFERMRKSNLTETGNEHRKHSQHPKALNHW
jgi:hypothetical protein